MKNTKFLGPTEKGKLIDLASSSNEAVKALLDEFDRLENRIRDLEIAVSIAVDKGSKECNPDWRNVLVIINA